MANNLYLGYKYKWVKQVSAIRIARQQCEWSRKECSEQNGDTGYVMAAIQ